MRREPRVLPASRAESIAADALFEAGVRVAGVRTVSIEPRLSAAVTAVAATVDEETGAGASRVVYVDESSDPAAVWVHPDDPHLPALAAAAFPHALAVLLARMGLPAAVESVEIAAYRPTRRAVIRARVGAGTVYVKVVRPDRVASIARRHRDFAEAGLPVPAMHGWSPSGLLVLAPADGTPLEAVVAGVDPDAIVREVDRLRARIATVAGTPPPGRPSVAARADWYASRLARRVPALAGDLGRLADVARRAHARRGPEVTAHGDLHVGQLFVADDARTLTGLIDVDTAATTDPGVDGGAFLAHAQASAVLADHAGEAARADAFRALAAAAEASWVTPADRTDREHAIAHLLAQAMQAACARNDVEAATTLIAGARRLAPDGGIVGSGDHEGALTNPSPVPHPVTRA
ncbi:phosphotransferase family protein [Agromyces sp. C10]|uniref:phosphotransferase family protein n=1 Tax=Agromyces sp. C10 TaxID=2935077 RepID=UPI00200B1E44|nr:phosphotransferase [Agromyces sp. C10]MCK8608678.1 aminoglycoside phosphotransferase family protein [Agromyces sp. C10]